MARTLTSCGRALFLVAWALAGTASAQETVVAGADGVRVPKRRKLVRPEYPPEAAAAGLRGIVILELVIGVDGTVDEVNVMRSVPPFDAAAVAAARQWEYEPTARDGEPVRVKLTVPISFLLDLPEISRQEGIPELRQGAIPRVPPEADREARVKALITLTPGGEIAEAQILEGDSPWSEALIQALRTWRFDANQIAGDVLTFQADARFIPAGRGEEGKVPIKLSELQRRPAPPEPAADAAPPGDDAGAAEPPGVAAPEPQATGEAAPPVPEPEPEPPSAPEGPAAASAPRAPGPEAEPPPQRGPVAPPGVTPDPVATAAEAPDPEATAAEAADSVEGEEAVSEPEIATATAPVAGAASAEPGLAAESDAPVEGADAGDVIEDVPTEVISAGPPASTGIPERPDEPGVSAVQGVFLGIGLPDLSSGRRPVVPPFARMQNAVGEVTVRFAITPAGTTTVRGVDGPEIFEVAARELVGSWFFSRQTAERLFAIARLSYAAEGASAHVELDLQPR